MPYALRHGVHLASCHRSLIAAEANSNSYFELSESEARHLLSYASDQSNPQTIEQENALEQLVKSGILIETNDPTSISIGTRDYKIPPLELRGSSLEFSQRMPTFRVALRIIMIQAQVSFCLKFQEITKAVGGFSPLRRAGGTPPSSQPAYMARELSEMYCRVRIYSPFVGKCLFHSICLKKLWAAHGISSKIIFGVRSTPFEAHCWNEAAGIQVDHIDNDYWNFVPIMEA